MSSVCPQAIIEALGVAIPQLSAVLGLFLILFIIFSLSGVALFSGSFHRRCVLPNGPDPSDYTYSHIPWFCGNLNPITHKSKARLGPLVFPPTFYSLRGRNLVGLQNPGTQPQVSLKCPLTQQSHCHLCRASRAQWTRGRCAATRPTRRAAT